MPTDPPYLQSPAFQEPHTGPYIENKHGQALLQRDPSPEQIARMCEAIRATWTVARTLQSLGVMSRRDWIRQHTGSEATHIPHGIPATVFGGQADLPIYGTPLTGGDA